MAGDLAGGKVWFATICVAKGKARQGWRVRLKGTNKGFCDV